LLTADPAVAGILPDHLPFALALARGIQAGNTKPIQESAVGKIKAGANT